MSTAIQIDKANKALALFAANGTIRKAIEEVGISGMYFYGVLQSVPAIKAEYARIKRMRAEIMLAEAYEISTDESVEPRLARVKADIRVKLAQLFAPEEYGDKLKIEVTQKPSLAAVLDRRFKAILSPARDLIEIENATDAEYTAITDQRTTDKASVDASETAEQVYQRVFGDD